MYIHVHVFQSTNATSTGIPLKAVLPLKLKGYNTNFQGEVADSVYCVHNAVTNVCSSFFSVVFPFGSCSVSVWAEGAVEG